MPIPSLQLKQKTCLIQRSRGFGHGVVLLKICYNILIVLPCDYCSGAASLSAAHVCKMSVSGIYCRHSFLEFQASNLYQKLEVPESGSASYPSLCCSWSKKPVSCREAKGLVAELSSPRFVTYNTVIVSKIWIAGYWLCSQLWHVTAANQWAIVEIELLATVAWMRGGQPFSCPHSQNVTHCRKEIFLACLF